MNRIGKLASIVGGMIILLGSLAVTASIANFREMIDPDLQFRIMGNETAGPEDGILPLSGHYVDIFDLNISLTNVKENFVLSIPRFFAETGNGTILWCQGAIPNVEPLILAGGSTEISIFFQVPTGEIVMSMVYYKPSGEKMDIIVPII